MPFQSMLAAAVGFSLHLLPGMGGTGHARQISLLKVDWKHQFAHGGTLRCKRRGRGQRPLSTREPLHVVFKARKACLAARSLRASKTFNLVNTVVDQYARRFRVKIEMLTIQHDHVHILLRCGRRSQFHSFFRVVAGQIAQRLEGDGLLYPNNVTDTPARKLRLWIYRPFSRVVRGWRANKMARDYIRLNEMEVRGVIPYRKSRLRGLTLGDWEALWE